MSCPFEMIVIGHRIHSLGKYFYNADYVKGMMKIDICMTHGLFGETVLMN